MRDAVSGALEAARVALDELDRRCCEPGRSPRLAELAGKLADIEAAADGAGDAAAATASSLLEDAGAMVGALQVGCCAPDRMPLYTTLLTQLNVLRHQLAPMH